MNLFVDCIDPEFMHTAKRIRTKSLPLLNPNNNAVPPLFHGTFHTIDAVITIYLKIFKDNGILSIFCFREHIV